MSAKERFRFTAFVLAITAAMAAVASAVLWLPAAFGASPAGTAFPLDPSVMKWGFAAAAAATGLSSISAGYAVGMVGSSGMGTLAERPEMLGRVLVLVGLAEGIAIYGLIISILILDRLG